MTRNLLPFALILVGLASIAVAAILTGSLATLAFGGLVVASVGVLAVDDGTDDKDRT